MSHLVRSVGERLGQLGRAIYGGAPATGGDVPVHPLFAETWRALEAALSAGRRRISRDVVSYPNLAEIYFHPEDHRELVAPGMTAVRTAVDAETRRILEHLGWSGGVAVYVLTADLAQVGLARGEVRVEVRHVTDPGLLADMLEGGVRTATRFGSAPAAARAPEPVQPEVGPATGPRVRLRWADARGAHDQPIAATTSFGRAAPDSTAEVQLAPGPEIADPAAYVVSRLALEVRVDGVANRISLVNRGSCVLVWAASASADPFEPGQERVVPDELVLRWPPGGAGGRGFELALHCECRGVATLRRGRAAVRVPLFAPVTRVLTAGTALGGEPVAFDVDLSRAEEGHLLLNPCTDQPIVYGELSGARDRKVLWPVAGGPLRVGDLSVELELA